jgi:hypothetical protein
MGKAEIEMIGRKLQVRCDFASKTGRDVLVVRETAGENKWTITAENIPAMPHTLYDNGNW